MPGCTLATLATPPPLVIPARAVQFDSSSPIYAVSDNLNPRTKNAGFFTTRLNQHYMHMCMCMHVNPHTQHADSFFTTRLRCGSHASFGGQTLPGP